MSLFPGFAVCAEELRLGCGRCCFPSIGGHYSSKHQNAGFLHQISSCIWREEGSQDMRVASRRNKSWEKLLDTSAGDTGLLAPHKRTQMPAGFSSRQALCIYPSYTHGGRPQEK